jgi:hypothetical protein
VREWSQHEAGRLEEHHGTSDSQTQVGWEVEDRHAELDVILQLKR